MFLGGVSTHSLSMISSWLIGQRLSPAEVSTANKELAVERWRTRNLSKESIKYLFINRVCFSMRIDGSVEMVSVLGVIGVRVSKSKSAALPGACSSEYIGQSTKKMEEVCGR